MTAKKSATKKSAGKPKTKSPRKPKSDAKRTSALDAAARVLAGAAEAMTTKQMIEAMAEKGYWASPKGKTPHGTLFSAIQREINTKGKEARFKKTERGKFTLA